MNFQAYRRPIVRIFALLGWLTLARLTQAPSAQAALATFDFDARFGKWLAYVAISASVIWFWLCAYYLGAIVLTTVRPNDTKTTDNLLKILLGFAALSWASVSAAHLGILNLSLACVLSVVAGFAKAPEVGVLWRTSLIKFQMAIRQVGNLGKIVACLLAAYLFPKFCEALLPSGHGDPIYYHVSSAWAWAQRGSASFDAWQPYFLQGGIFEYAYALLGVLLQDPMALLIAGQLLHAGVTLFIGTILFYLIARKIALTSLFALLATLAFVTIAVDPFTVVRAKNDGFILVMGLAALLGFMQWRERPRETVFLVLTLLFSAAAFSGKHTAAFFLAPFLPYVLWSARRQSSKSFRVVLWSSLACLPLAFCMLARNWLYTGNPFFPALPAVFPSPLMNTELATSVGQYTKNALRFHENFTSLLVGTCADKPFLFLFPGAIYVLWQRPQFWVFAFTVATFVMTSAVSGYDPYSSRFFLLSIGMASLLAALVAQRLWRRIVSAGSAGAYFFFATLLAAILINSSFEVPLSRFFRRTLPFLVSGKSFYEDLAEQRPIVRAWDYLSRHYTSGVILANASGESLFVKQPVAFYSFELRANKAMQAASPDEFRDSMRALGFVAFLRGMDHAPEGNIGRFLGELDRFMKCVYDSDGYKIYEP